MSATAHAPGHAPGHDAGKRDFLKLVATASAAIGAGAIVWPMIDSMNPSRDVLAVGAIEVDLKPIVAGQAIVTQWRGKPILSAEQIEDIVAYLVTLRE